MGAYLLWAQEASTLDDDHFKWGTTSNNDVTQVRRQVEAQIQSRQTQQPPVSVLKLKVFLQKNHVMVIHQ